MRTPYQDVEILERTGYWPDGKVPDWAEKLFAKRDGCRSASAAADWAKSQEIDRLRAVNAKLLEACSSMFWHCTCRYCGYDGAGATEQPCEVCERCATAIEEAESA